MKDKEKELTAVIETVLRETKNCDMSIETLTDYLVDRIKNKVIIEDSVVLSKGAYESLSSKAKANVVNAVEIRKKTAEKILFKFESAFAYYDNEDMFSKKAIFECLEEIVKSCGVEIKE